MITNESPRTAQDALLKPEARVLPTLEQDGSRRWLQPQLSKGNLWKWRRAVAYVLMAVFVLIPHLRLGGKPILLLDIAARRFTILGHTFLPTDTLLLAFLVIGVMLTVVLGTAIAGRIWCGWACPQTVYMEFLFRPIDRLITGTMGKGGPGKHPLKGIRLIARWAIYLVLSMFLAHTFLAYFVGSEKLAVWIRSSPFSHPFAFLVMGGTTMAMLFDFLFFREQLCMIACPYGRFQSVMLDRRSLIVAYDYGRGEPRAKGKRDESAAAIKGDCVDCNRCVVVCPTGIDIRDGLQLECINCTQCIDACNDVMDRVGTPRGLIRYSSQDALEGKRTSVLRPRTLIYPLLLGCVATAFFVTLSSKFAFDVGMTRAPGSPFTVIDGGQIQNNMRLQLANRSEISQTYKLRALSPESLVVEWTDQNDPRLEPGKSVMLPLALRFPGGLTARVGHVSCRVEVTDEIGNRREVACQLLGPR